MVNVNVNLKGARQKLSQNNIKRGRYAFANQAMADMNQFVPMKEGILRLTATIDIDGTGINYNTPYAKAQFYGFTNGGRVYNYTTPGTSRRWDLRGKIRYMSEWERVFMKGADW
ncbi:minor capsid protein [Siminovitchia terrae]|uniref:minor capsid protein n=1 Tax=Siminovitchia terrae TaxID=1914933 RepID=UPI0028B01BF5|nr:minor capsid protein [Siminovitchia terrae]